MFQKIETNFKLDRHLIELLHEIPFFAELSRHIHKVPTDKMPTAAVGYDIKNDELTLFWNPEFFASLTPQEIKGVLIHEFYHVIFAHIHHRRRTPHDVWNIATDLAINSIISTSDNKNAVLPKFCLFPGQKLVKPDGRSFTKDEKTAYQLSKLIESFPKMKASEWYFYRLLQDQMENPEKYDEGDIVMSGIGSMDDHSFWDDIPEAQREYVEGKIKSFIEKAAKHADGQQNGWGNIPAEIQSAVRSYISNIVDWRAVLRNFVGQLARAGRSSSIKKINKKYPYIHPGHKTAYTAKLLIAIDQSGSVDDEQLALFFAELGSLTKRITVDILPFDCSANSKMIYTWRKGATPVCKRVLTGGTNFDAPSDVVNDQTNRGRWDGYLILTDGQAPKPKSSRIRRAWVISKNNKLMFQSSELTVSLDEQKKSVGAYR